MRHVPQALIEVKDLSLQRQDRQVLQSIQLQVRAGELVGVLGANGAGKSSLLQVMAGLLVPTEGQVSLDSHSIHAWSAQQRARYIAWLAQGRELHWPLPVREVVALGRFVHGMHAGNMSKADQAACERAMRSTGVWPFAERSSLALSGGELARVLLARALAVEAPVLLADEPIAGLDPFYQLSVMQTLRAEAQRQRAVVVVLHDLNLAARFCDRLILLHHGRVLAEGAPASVLTEAHLATAFRVAVRIQSEQGDNRIVPLHCLDQNDA